MAVRMQQRRGTSSQWTSANPILAAGEIGFETNTGEFRVGDGVNHWSDLSPFKNILDLGGNLDDYVPLTSVGAANGVASLDSSGYVASGQLGNVQPIIESVVSDLHTTISGEIVTAINNSETSTQNAYSLAINTAIDDAINTAAADATTKANNAKSGAETTASGYVSTHAAVTTNVHGISNTANLVYTNDSRLSDTRTPSSLSVSTGTIVDGAVTSAKIADGTIVAGDIADGAITSAKILDGTINNGDISATAAIAATKISGTAVTQADTGTVTSTMIADGTIVNADINASAAIATSKISGLDTALAGKLALSGGTMTGALTLSGSPTSDLHAATKAYVDAAVQNVNIHESVVAATTANITLSTAVDNGKTLDGVTLATGNRILVKNQSTASQNGIYIVAASGAPSRATDYDTVGEVSSGDFIFVEGGTVNANTGWIQTYHVNTIGTDPLNFTQFSGAGTYSAGTGLTLTGTAFSIGTGAITSAMILDGTIVDADINASAAISQSKISGLSTSLALKANLAAPSFTGGVTVDSSGIIFTDGTQTKQGVPSLTSINQQTASYTGVLTDRDKLIEINSASATTLTIPTNASVAYPVGTSFDILQTGAGQVTIAGASGVTVNATPGLKLRTQWSSATLFKRATDTWVVFGDLSA